jgi:hypothetical protein
MEIEELLKLTAERCKNANGDYPPPHLVRQVVEMCERAGVSPLEPWVYLIPRKGKWSVEPSINWTRLVAEKTGRFLGVTETLWLDENGCWLDYWVAPYAPLAAKKGVYIAGNPNPSWGTANKELAGGGPMWAKIPAHMLAKVAERIALQTAFPAEVGADVSHEEMEGVYSATTEIQAPPKKEIVLPTAEQWDDLRNILAHPCISDAAREQAMQVAGKAMSKSEMQKVVKQTELWAADKVAKYEAAQQAPPTPEIQQPETDDDEVVMHHEVPR